MGPRNHPKSAAVVLPSESETAAQILSFSDALELLTAQQIIESLCMQERAYGTSGLQPPEIAP
jgi:hypothetical protein